MRTGGFTRSRPEAELAAQQATPNKADSLKEAVVSYVSLASRFVLATVFVLAGLSKLSSPSSFRRAVSKYRVLPEALEGPVAAALPPFELVCGVALMLGVGTAIAGLALAAALLGFTAVVGRALVERRVIDCGCFGPTAPRKITWVTFLRNVLLLAMAVVVSFLSSDVLSIAPFVSHRASLSPRTASAILIATTTGTLMVMVASESLRAGTAGRVLARHWEGES